MRYEKKYKIEHLTAEMVKQAILLHPAGFRKIYPDRQVNNIYFDTPQLTTYKHNVAGISKRKKYRVRWYGTEPTAVVNPNFEIKMKENQLGSKKVTPVDAFTINDLKPVTAVANKLSGSDVPLRPVLMNSYVRSYFGIPSRQFRVTVDKHLRYFSCLNAGKFTSYKIQEPVIVLEIKYDESLDNAIDPIMQFFPFRQTKSSKYVTGVELTW